MYQTAKIGTTKNLVSTNFLLAVERFKIKGKYLSIVAYKLQNGEVAITLRQAAVSVKKTPPTVKEFMRDRGIRPWKVQMPNHCITDMIALSAVAKYWKHLNESGQGNLLTKLGQEMLANYLN